MSICLSFLLLNRHKRAQLPVEIYVCITCLSSDDDAVMKNDFCNVHFIMGWVSQYIDYDYSHSDLVIIEDKNLEFLPNYVYYRTFSHSHLYFVSVPKAKSITYAQIPFYLSNLSDTEDILNIVLQIRSICDDFASRGLPNYPSGIPFTFWEQYIKLRLYLFLALLCILVVTFLVLTFVLMNPWLAIIIVSLVLLIYCNLYVDPCYIESYRYV